MNGSPIDGVAALIAVLSFVCILVVVLFSGDYVMSRFDDFFVWLEDRWFGRYENEGDSEGE